MGWVDLFRHRFWVYNLKVELTTRIITEHMGLDISYTLTVFEFNKENGQLSVIMTASYDYGGFSFTFFFIPWLLLDALGKA